MLGDKIKQRLNSLALNQKDLAFKLNISPSTLNGYITGYRTPDIHTLKRISDELKVPPSYFLQDEEGSIENILPLRLRQLRQLNGFLQKDIADKLNITASAYGFYEQGKRTPDSNTLNKLAEIFNISTDYLLGRTDDSQNGKILTVVQDDPELTSLIKVFSEDPTKRDFLNYLKDKDDNHIKLLAGLAKTIEEQEKIRKAQETL